MRVLRVSMSKYKKALHVGSLVCDTETCCGIGTQANPAPLTCVEPFFSKYVTIHMTLGQTRQNRIHAVYTLKIHEV
jgi:hypothetical protein